MNIAEHLADVGIRLRGYGNGSQKVVCPKCSHTRRNKTDPCLSVTISDEGVAYLCHHCGWKGGARDHDERPAQVVRFKARDADMPSIGPLSHDAVEFFTRRGLSADVLREAGVGCTTWFIPAKQARVPCIAFPYREPGGKVVNVKFRTLDKDFAQVKGGKKLLFGWDRVNLDENQLVLCEGEIDALSLTQAGVVNACSVPDGASDRKWDFLDDEELARFDRIVIAGDADDKGRELANELARRFGYERCWKVRWPEDCKDANDVLVKHGAAEVANRAACADAWPITGLHTILEYEPQIFELYHGGHKRGVSTGWSNVDKRMTIRGGELSVVTGIPGSGKSEFIDAMMVNLARAQEWSFAICSFENPPEEHFAKLAEKFVGQPFFEGPRPRMSENQVADTIIWAQQKFFLIRTEDEAPTIAWILEKARVAVIRHGIKGLVIDPYNEIEHQRPAGMTETEYVSDMLNRVKRFARNHDLHVWFVAHPAKPMRTREGDYPVPSLYDISGSANWSNKADIGIVVERNFDSNRVVIHVKKVRFKAIGIAGTAELEYDRATGIYSAVVSDEPPPRYGAYE